MRAIGDEIFRYDTRVYLNPIDFPRGDDICIGAIVGKNPGSAIASYDGDTDSARHTQGMKHDLIVPYIGKLLEKIVIDA